MTNISVRRTGPFTAEDRSWLAGPHGTEPGTMPSITVDTELFPSGAKTAGYIKSGSVLGRVTATGLYGPYDSGASDGREVARGLLFSSIDTSRGEQKAGTGLLVHGFVYEAKLPGGAPASGVKTALNLIHFA